MYRSGVTMVANQGDGNNDRWLCYCPWNYRRAEEGEGETHGKPCRGCRGSSCAAACTSTPHQSPVHWWTGVAPAHAGAHRLEAYWRTWTVCHQMHAPLLTSTHKLPTGTAECMYLYPHPGLLTTTDTAKETVGRGRGRWRDRIIKR